MRDSDRILTLGVPPRGLARAQAESLARLLVEHGHGSSIHLEIIEHGDETDTALHDDHIAENRTEIRRLHRHLIEGAIDVVIHRGFDLRGCVPEDLRILAVLPRAKPFEVMVSPRGDSLDTLENGDRLGVVHLRSRAQILEYRPELDVEIVRGDAGDWLTAMIDGDVDALIAPGAAIEQMGLQAQVTEIFPAEMIVPAPGSGILVCLGRRDDIATAEMLRVVHDAAASSEYAAECALVETLGGAWEMPIGVLARRSRDSIVLHAVVAAPDGSRLVRCEHVAPAKDPCRAGIETAALLVDDGADDLIFEPEDDLPDPIAGHLPCADAEWETEFD